MKLRFIAPLLLTLSISNALAADNTPYMKNDMPCMSGICIGDHLSSLSKVNWDKVVPYTRQSKQSAMPYLQKSYKGNLNRIWRYLLDDPMSPGSGRFDNTVLAYLNDISASCSLLAFTGTFKSEEGNPSKVSVTLLPIDGGSKQAWIVTNISRSFPKAISAEQKAEVEASLKQRYSEFDLSNPEVNARRNKVGTGSASITGNGFVLGLYPDSDSENQRLLHPECGGGAKVKID